MTSEPIYWIFGQSGAGKTTLSKTLAVGLEAAAHIVVRLDGDDLREIWPDIGLSIEDRLKQNFRAARLAALLAAQGFTVIVSTICPYRMLRDEISRLIAPRWIYLPGGVPTDDEHPFEPPN